jgi:hypothetical protein
LWGWVDAAIPPSPPAPTTPFQIIYQHVPTYVYIGDNPLAEWSESDPIISIIGIAYKLLVVGNVGLLVGSVLLSSTNSPIY